MLTKIIWIFWDNVKKPFIVKKCIKKIKKINPNWKVNILTLKNYKNYTKDSFPYSFNKYTIQMKSDWIRVKVISMYGGLWSDASIIYLKPMDEFVNFNCDLFCIGKGKKQIENWFFYSPLESTIVNKWLKEYEYALHIGSELYVKNNNITGYSGGLYLFHQLALMNVIYKNKGKWNIYKRNYGWFPNQFKLSGVIFDFFINNCENYNNPLYKLRGIDRRILNIYYILFGYVNKNSLSSKIGYKSNYFNIFIILVFIIILFVSYKLLLKKIDI